jgi:dimethylhistidine N-methyltransferase
MENELMSSVQIQGMLLAPERCPRKDAFAADVLRGLSQTPKTIPSTYFYDKRGSRLFERITELDEYYLTRCEVEALQACAGHLVSVLQEQQPFRLIELGAGDGRKTETLLWYFLARRLQFDYVPIDICRHAVRRLTHSLRCKLPAFARHIHGIVAEHSDALSLLVGQNVQRNVVFFLGSSIGNCDPPATRRFLQDLRVSLHEGDYALLGFDLKKDLSALLPAYNDSQGVTREFNLNLLDRINRELGGDFDRNRFMHYSPYNAQEGCMESWLVSREDQQVRVDALGRVFSFRAWEGIRVERSYKYGVAEVEDLAAEAGFAIRQHFFDRRRYFLDSLWQVPGPDES